MRHLLALLLCLPLAAQIIIVVKKPSGAGGTVTYDNTASGGANSSPLSFNITIGSGSNRAVAVGCSFSSSVTGITVTVGGSSATLVSGTQSSGESYISTIHVLAAPSSGSQSVSVSWTGTSSTYCGAVSASGVDQATPMNNGTFEHNGSGPTASVTITTTTGDLTFSVVSCESGSTPTSPNQTSRWAASQNFTTGSGGQTATGTGTISHTWATGSGWLMSGANFKHD